MDKAENAVILVGHGGVPRDMPRAWVSEMKRLRREGEHAEADALEHKIRHHPRTAQSDPYMAGLVALADALREALTDRRVVVAYNEFCAPTLQQAIAGLVADEVRSIVVMTTMITPGGSHSEKDIPVALAEAKANHRDVEIRFAWPMDLGKLAAMFAAHA